MTKRILTAVFTLILLLPILPTSQAQSETLMPPPILEILHSDETGLGLEFTSPDSRIKTLTYSTGTFDLITIPGMDSTSEPGKPQLPMFSALIGVPPNAHIQIEILADESETLPDQYKLSPVPSPAWPEADLAPGEYIHIADAAAYASDTLYPQSPVRIADDAWLRDQRLVRVEFYPLQYNPAQGSLLWHRQLQIEITFINQDGAAEASGSETWGDNPFDSALRDTLINYETAKKWRSSQAGHGEVAANSQSPISNTQSPAYKIIVDHDGLYRMTYAELQATGMDVTNIDPTTFAMSNQGRDVAIHVSGEGDHNFDSSDHITFYGQEFRGDYLGQVYADENAHWRTNFTYFSDGAFVSWTPQFNATMLEKYTNENVYWLTVGGTPGPRMAEVNGDPAGSSAATPDYYYATIHLEESHEWWSWHFTGEDTWFWERVSTTGITTRTYTTTLSAIASEAITATVRGEVVARNFNNTSSPDHHTKFYLNAGSQPIDDDTWDGHTRYAFESQVSASNLLEGENQLHFVVLKTANMASDRIYSDWFEIKYPRQFQASDDQLVFAGDQAGTWQYVSTGYGDNDIEIYDITDPISPTRVLAPSISAAAPYTVTFETTHGQGAQYLVAAVGAAGVVQSPKSISYYTPPDFSATTGADYVFITHRDFITATQTLANYRASQGLTSMVIDVDDLYNQFNFGIFNPIAIKNFLAYTFENWTSPPEYALLIGSGHWNFKGYQGNTYDYWSKPIYMPPNLAWVDPWQGEVDSANLLAAVVGGDILPDLAIGRIPVDSAAELDAVIAKIIAYEQGGFQDWHHNIIFVADSTPDSAGNFVASSEAIINNNLPPDYQPLRIYEDDYGCVAANSPECQAVTDAITHTLNYTGALVVNYIGHGASERWASEQILRTTDEDIKKDDPYYNHIASMQNGSHLPIVFDLTCLTGYWIHTRPNNVSLAVNLLKAEDSGAVATFSPTGLGVEAGHDILNSGFYDALFQDDIWELGPASVVAKLDLYATGSNEGLIHTYTVFGDPALRIQHPALTVFLPLIRK